MDNLSSYSCVRDVLALVEREFEALLSAPEVVWRDARPPSTSGIYAFVEDEKIVYVGEAKGSGGLWDRIMRKHMSGDDKHAMQRAFQKRYPDRRERRSYMSQFLKVKWVEIPNSRRVSAVEIVAIMVLDPLYNRRK